MAKLSKADQAELKALRAWEAANPQRAPEEQAPEQMRGADMSWGDVAQEAASNIPASAAQFGSDVVQPILHPIETAKTLGSLGLGIIQKFIPGHQPEEEVANAVGKFFVDRYGDINNIKKTLATDPVGVLADLSTLLTGGSMAAARAPGVVGKLGRVAAKGAEFTDPLRLAAKTVGAVGKAVPHAVGGLGLHTGARPVQEAYRAGKAGGERGRAFTESIRDKRPVNQAVEKAKEALELMRKDRSETYVREMAEVGKVPTVLDFTKVDDALRKVADIGQYKGKKIYPQAEKVWQEIADAVDDWRVADPAEFHTPIGLDALKRRIGGIKASQAFGSPERVIANDVYSAVRKLIVDEAPDYGKIMKDYERASDLMQEVEKTMSLTEKGSVDTALRKLQSIMRDNVNTNYGQRVKLGEELDRLSGGSIMPQIAGQTLKSITPRGLGKLQAGLTTAGGIATNPLLLGLLPFQSPRLVGEAAHKMGQVAGQVARPASKAAQQLPDWLVRGAGQLAPALSPSLFQVGRIQGDDPRRRAGLLGQSPQMLPRDAGKAWRGRIGL